jgi:hypothetical protein
MLFRIIKRAGMKARKEPAHPPTCVVHGTVANRAPGVGLLCPYSARRDPVKMPRRVQSNIAYRSWRKTDPSIEMDVHRKSFRA